MANLSDNLLFCYKKNKRNLPWRRKKDLKNPYFVWLSEIMLQQTTVAAAINYYEKFINKLDPDIITGYNIFGFDFKYL